MCHICEINADTDALPHRERLYLDRHRRVSHGWSSLPGWLVVAARRHVESLAELELAALEQAVGCVKTYVILFAEHPRYPHLHVHVVPRMEWFGDDDRSTRVFRFLRVEEQDQVSVAERERLAAEIGGTVERLLA